ncbi:MAG: HlyD family efflux transporter periplasmic adaptor subunit [Candidatus Eisenbacteria bacterium]
MSGRRAVGFVALILMMLSILACKKETKGSGTIELDEVDVASLVGGRLVMLSVNEGDTVHAGDTLAVLDRGEVAAELNSQIAQADRAQSQARDLASGARPAEVTMARAELAATEAERRLAEADFQRAEQLAKGQVIAQAELDRTRARRDATAARAKAASEQLRIQEQGFRRMQVSAARDAAKAAVAMLAGARSRAGELVLRAPRNGVVLLKNFEVGEVVTPGVPVVTLGDPETLWIRVYLAAPELPGVQVGSIVQVRPVGSRQTFPGRVVSIATDAEFTPRAALTEEEQSNLVFAVKVVLAPSRGVLKPGLPADAVFAHTP